jgi:hypothetical protein
VRRAHGSAILAIFVLTTSPGGSNVTPHTEADRGAILITARYLLGVLPS